MRLAYLEQAYEFGQCPIPVFTKPHPPTSSPTAANTSVGGSLSSSTAFGSGLELTTQSSAGGDGDGTVPREAAAAGESVIALHAAALAAAAAQREEAAAAQATLVERLTQIRQSTRDTAEGEARGKIQAASRRFGLQLERVERQLADREKEAAAETEVHEESMEALKRWYQQKWVAIKSQQLETHFTSKLEAQEEATAVEVGRWKEERAKLAAELQESETRRQELASQADKLRKENHGIKQSRDQQVRGLVYKLNSLQQHVERHTGGQRPAGPTSR